MVIAFLQVLQESVKKVLPSAERKAKELPIAAIAALAGTVITKGLIWIGLTRVDGKQVQALSQGSFAPSFHSDIRDMDLY